ncbi:putative serine/threonine-protein kinase PBL3 [Vitis vinifera]|uniref:Putative serine/threonine-protein kinase PBL3 n=1 Tax=Vitis vinifera TaxID=29760 RepID=A0A438BUP8_VITVI|nr:putative serine/threonine-protein kinase PBL3 [Vitis vinifera]
MHQGHLSTRCDIYSFGVVLLEILSGRRAIDKTKPRAEEKLVSWARPYLNDKKMFYRIMDSRMEGGYPKTGAYIASTLALQHCRTSQSAQQSAPSPVGRSTVGSSNPSPHPHPPQNPHHLPILLSLPNS